MVPIIMAVVGFIFNQIYVKKIDDINNATQAVNQRIDKLEIDREKDQKEYFEQLNGLRKSLESTYVRDDIYRQMIQFQTEKNDDKFKSLLTVVNTRFESLESQTAEIKKLLTDKLIPNVSK